MTNHKTPAENPFVRLRRERGLSRLALAQALGVSYGRVVALELGYSSKVGHKVRDGLATLGVNPDLVEREYGLWLDGRRYALLARDERDGGGVN
ncbi:MAG: helix-turn-helix transcriptional regulator [Bacillota bacterium]|nr:helix-turn-helix transcriptional regulator [Bacillota bacterium]